MSSDRYPVSRENRRGMVLIVAVVCIIIVALTVKCRALADRNDVYAQQIETLEQKITEEEGRGGFCSCPGRRSEAQEARWQEEGGSG